MSKMTVVMKREFLEFVQSRMFLVGTLLGPLLIAGFIALEVFILNRTGGGDYSLVVIDQTSAQVGQQFAETLPALRGSNPMSRAPAFTTSVLDAPANLQHVTDSLEQRVSADSLHGYLIIPPGHPGR